MPDPLDLAVNIGPGNEYLEDIRYITQTELAENFSLLGLNPMFLGDSSKDPLEVLAECEDLDEAGGWQRGTHLEIYYETLQTQTFKTGLIITIRSTK